ncbi:MurR/RpiR family transcriptional regulator [Aquincola sp. S2]|uniref:MurR/RpiR family transcriptional regulator n=1 Tax=Pseudaquabacterium terrae TaxID=2732868 RepID=A0ABX2EP86_9BURK|nr:MurR/RpiR family transcriptional regulator [Aquabacterium terrae]NRF70428.1 MurR/RpiR family transcriptional regulator [Aquabacterium terrae]
MLNRIQTQLAQLSTAERAVGDWVIAHPTQALEQDTRTLARQIGVSQPTLVRFARSLGCAGYDHFRLKLAQEIAQRPASRPPVTLATLAASADLDALTRGLFDFSIAALAQVREQLDRAALARAVALLDGGRQVLCFGYGNAASVADDARRRLLRLQLQVSAAAEPSLQALAAAQLGTGDVLLVISHSGQAPGLSEMTSEVRGRGVAVIALTSSAAPLVRLVDVALCLDVPDSGDALTPGTAQLAQLALLDLLTLALASTRAAKATRRAARVRKQR